MTDAELFNLYGARGIRAVFAAGYDAGRTAADADAVAHHEKAAGAFERLAASTARNPEQRHELRMRAEELKTYAQVIRMGLHRGASKEE